jgi:hypothetical protein
MAVAAITIHHGRPTSSLPKPKPLSPLSLAWHGANPCKCECSDTERSAFYRSSPVVARLAVGSTAHAHAHRPGKKSYQAHIPLATTTTTTHYFYYHCGDTHHGP